MAEKRDIARRRKRVRVRFGIETPQKMAFTDDLSFVGLFIKTVMPEKPGTLLQLEITLPDETPVLCSGRICWAKRVPPNMLRLVNKGGMGVRIVDYISGKEAYQEFVESLHR
ncbi:PilZ domain-containing protein [Geopsychrobacter electrodiphilus]|uniref:PilZ domain-containing protein n=1 Tax=Geopsychrobacter electrodiphilus TaxID=225196 RepID=UPI0003A79AFA|nr:PilZ domain-containing protein [Geopsychrobacter electrodiphilus]